MGGFIAFILSRLPGQYGLAWRGLFVVYLFTEFVRVFFGNQAGKRHCRKIRVAQMFGTICKRQFHAFRHQMNGLRSVVPEFADGIRFQEIQYLNDMHSAGTGRGHGIDVISAICAVNGFADDWLVCGQVFFGDQSAIGLHCRDDQISNFTFVESVRALFGNLFQGSGQILLNEKLAHIIRFSAFLEKEFHAGIRCLQPFFRGDKGFPKRSVHGIAFFRKFNGRFQRTFQGDGPVFFQDHCQTGHRAGDTCCLITVPGFFRVCVPVFVQIHIPRGLLGCFFPVIHSNGLT